MPVDDHPVHESTKIDVATYRHGCHNHEPASGYYVLVREIDETKNVIPKASNRPYKLVQEFIPHRTSRDCKYDWRDSDPACTDCKWLTLSVD